MCSEQPRRTAVSRRGRGVEDDHGGSDGVRGRPEEVSHTGAAEHVEGGWGRRDAAAEGEELKRAEGFLSSSGARK